MIKLNLTHSFTGKDLRDAAAPDNVYICHIHWSLDARQKAFEFVGDDSKNLPLALEGLALTLVSIKFDDHTYPVTLDWLKEYQASIEEQNPGMSEWYLLELAHDIFNYQYQFTDSRLKNSQAPLPQSVNGNGKKEERLAERQLS